MPIIPGLIETFEKAIEIHKKKNEDYTGKSTDPFYNFNVAEYIASQFESDRNKVFATMVGIKLGRLAALLNSGKTPNNESIEDSFDDLIVYAGIWKSAYLDKDRFKVPLEHLPGGTISNS